MHPADINILPADVKLLPADINILPADIKLLPAFDFYNHISISSREEKTKRISIRIFTNKYGYFILHLTGFQNLPGVRVN